MEPGYIIVDITPDKQTLIMSLIPEQATAVIVPAQLEPINTPRLLLRPMRVGDDEDAAGIFTIRSRRDVMDWLWPRDTDSTIQDTKDWMARKTFTTPDASGTSGQHFYFLMIPKDDRDPSLPVIGAVGINALVPAPSVGYAMHPDFWGRGYATEAVRAVVQAWWSLPRVKGMGDGERLYAATNCANQGSLKVLQRNGFQIYREVQLEGDTVACLLLDCPEESVY